MCTKAANVAGANRWHMTLGSLGTQRAFRPSAFTHSASLDTAEEHQRKPGADVVMAATSLFISTRNHASASNDSQSHKLVHPGLA
jgi:hypothetical protein